MQEQQPKETSRALMTSLHLFADVRFGLFFLTLSFQNGSSPEFQPWRREFKKNRVLSFATRLEES